MLPVTMALTTSTSESMATVAMASRTPMLLYSYAPILFCSHAFMLQYPIPYTYLLIYSLSRSRSQICIVDYLI